MAQSGKLYLVPTPIGNLEDITLRALRILKEADYILAEDTRQTLKLLSHYQISNTLHSFHSHNEHRMLEQVMKDIEQGKTIAQVSDAGTPGISDPGFLLSRACLEKGLPLECLPGATAFVPALVKSGLPCDEFTFIGFLPEKKGRQTAFQKLVNETRTCICYESPHRLLKALNQFVEFLGPDRRISVSRELSKLFEETINGTCAEVLAYFETHTIKGEFVIVVEGKK